MNEKEQISEDLLNEILDKVYDENDVAYARPYVKEKCKSVGLIKESALDKARNFKLNELDFYVKNHHTLPGYGDGDFDTYEKEKAYAIKQVDIKISLYEKAIEELLQEKPR